MRLPFQDAVRPMDLQPGRPLAKHEIAALLQEARSRTLALVEPLSESDLTTQHSPLMSPIVWDLGHIAHFEEVWLVDNLESGGSGSEGLRGVYDPFENPRSVRGSMTLPGRDEALGYMHAVRERVLAHLNRVDLEGGGALLRDGYVFRMVLQHEYQHNETILQTLQLKQGRPYSAPRTAAAGGGRREEWGGGGGPPVGSMVKMPGGVARIGTDDRSEAYDNERPAHTVELEPYWIDTTPVTNGQYLAFMADGGYGSREYWSEEGWRWKEEEDAVAPGYWFREDDRWRVRRMDRVRDVDRSRPVCHVSWWEAEAFARWAGKRLPTEPEWEAAASWDPASLSKRRYPWGDAHATPLHANVDAPTFDTAPVGSHPGNVSPVGCHGMIGDVWEWTASAFTGYPGFEAFPYREYSEVFFGDGYRVLRGGSWATRAGAVRATFRNWDYPQRRQIFSGFRCARDAG